MFKFEDRKSALVVFVLIECLSFTFTEALQCYDCKNCEYGEDFSELQICGGFPASVRPTSTITTTDSFISTNAEDSDYSTEKGDELDEVVTNPTMSTLRPSNIRTSRRTSKTTTTSSTTPRQEDAEESNAEYSDYDSGDEGDWRKNQRVSKVDDAVCYMVKFKVNDTIITNRGCATWVRANTVLTCESLNLGEELYDCQLCETNGCNKFAEDDSDWYALWNAGAKVSIQIWLLIPLLVMLAVWKFLIYI